MISLYDGHMGEEFGEKSLLTYKKTDACYVLFFTRFGPIVMALVRLGIFYQNKNMTEVTTSFLIDRSSSLEKLWLTGEIFIFKRKEETTR